MLLLQWDYLLILVFATLLSIRYILCKCSCNYLMIIIKFGIVARQLPSALTEGKVSLAANKLN